MFIMILRDRKNNYFLKSFDDVNFEIINSCSY